ncbi:hypothetical protein E8E11_007321 [Didymella keratinophila]|nr:hypothetical protein E8E11_007321 [Didymella keratinophila]
MASNVSIISQIHKEREAGMIKKLNKLYLRSYAQYLAASPQQPYDDLRDIRPTLQEYFQECLAHFESANYLETIEIKSKTPPSSTSPKPLMPHTNELESSRCGSRKHLDRNCPCNAGRTPRYEDNNLLFALMQGLNHGHYEIGKPGYVHFEKTKTLAAEGDHVDFDYSKQQLHPLRNVLVIPAHKVDARVPKSCVLLGGLQYENEEDEDSEMDRWFLQWLHDHNLKPKAEVTDWCKTGLLYHLNDPQERYDFVYTVLEERNKRREQFSATLADQHKRKGKYCPER